MNSSFIKLDRKILEWEWYHDHKIFKFFLHCLIKANWTDKRSRGMLIKRSTFATSYATLQVETGLTVKEIRRAISRLTETGEIKINLEKKSEKNFPKSQKKGKAFTLITVCNYDTYQPLVDEEGKERAKQGQGEGKERARTKNNKKEKKEKKEKNTTNVDVYRIVNENLKMLMENEQYISAITQKFNLTHDELFKLYEEFNDHCNLTQNNVKTMTDYTSHFMNWYCKRYDVNIKTGKPNKAILTMQDRNAL
jgi:hypothetical protein